MEMPKPSEEMNSSKSTPVPSITEMPDGVGVDSEVGDILMGQTAPAVTAPPVVRDDYVKTSTIFMHKKRAADNAEKSGATPTFVRRESEWDMEDGESESSGGGGEEKDGADGGFDGNMEAEIRRMLDIDFPNLDVANPDIYDLVESVVLAPCFEDAHCSHPDAEWKVKTWVEFLGPDQEWHLATVAKVHEEEDESTVDVLSRVEETLQREKENTRALLGEIMKRIDSNAIEIQKNSKSVKRLSTTLTSKMKPAMESIGGRVSPDPSQTRVNIIQNILKGDALESGVDIDNMVHFYDCGYHNKRLESKYIRGPEEGLRALYGGRPWLWQQYALLRYEEKVRFQVGHVDDYENLNPVEFAQEEWSKFYEKFRANNRSHALYNDLLNEKTESLQKLKNHLISPFVLLDDIRTGETWESFEEASCFTYLSVLGSGYLIPVVCMLIQILMLLMLIVSEVGNRERDVFSCPSGGISNSVVIFAVSILYLTKVVPDQLVHFYYVAGNANVPYSKMMSLRASIHSKGEDMLGQVVGFNIDIFMNSAFKSIALLLNIYVLFGTEEIIDLILNCIALEFISEMDEQYIDSDWWDPDDRWLRAGCMELTLRKYIATYELQDKAQVIEKFDLTEDDIMGLNELKSSGKTEFELCGFKNLRRAINDSETFQDSPEEANMRLLVRVVNEIKRPQATREFIKAKKFFGITGKAMMTLQGWLGFKERSHKAVFWKFYPYRTWKTWNKLLYCPIGRFSPSGNPDPKRYFMNLDRFVKRDKLVDIACVICQDCREKGKCCNDHCFRKALSFSLTKMIVEASQRNETFVDRMGSFGGELVRSVATSIDATSSRLSPTPWKEREGGGVTSVESPIHDASKQRSSRSKSFDTLKKAFRKSHSMRGAEPYEVEELRKSSQDKYKKFEDFANFDNFSKVSPVMSFVEDVFHMFIFKKMKDSVAHAINVKNRSRIFTLFVDWMLRWWIWVVSLLFFPTVVIAVIIGLPMFCMKDEVAAHFSQS
ncbi:hypothetical protein TrRE_jg8826 [Triparma retinervis]|uniref:Uncharacterized protein n=1 Tax=Triparma retinervis TaxID=2557542 RepID=A0A9W7DL14_9STRA|nr:hypothetical protein TrRE_jg8826 [Triparma retinervis]